MEHIVLVTGRLAEQPLRQVMASMGEMPFTWEVREIGVQVAALMTTELVRRRVAAPLVSLLADGSQRPATRLLLPGRARGDLDILESHFGIPVERGPDELRDLPRHFDRQAHPVDLSAHDCLIFAEITEAPLMTVADIVQRALELAGEGADVIDLGTLPQTPFPHLEDAVRALKAEGLRVSVDSLDSGDLRRGGKAGADYLLSLTIDTIDLIDEVDSTPILIPSAPTDMASLDAAIAAMRRRGRPFLADPILEPIPYGLAASIARYHDLRQRDPDVAMLMGTGNLSELTEADTSGMHALLLGLCAELRIGAVLTTQVSPHCRRAVREIALARRIMHAAVAGARLPKSLHPGLATVHDRAVPTDDEAEIEATAAQVRDPNFRIQVAPAGLRVYNRDGLRRSTSAYGLWPQLGLQQDASHAFYMGLELGQAELAWRLGKRYVQDQPLDWGVGADAPVRDDGDGHRVRGLAERAATRPDAPAAERADRAETTANAPGDHTPGGTSGDPKGGTTGRDDAS